MRPQGAKPRSCPARDKGLLELEDREGPRLPGAEGDGPASCVGVLGARAHPSLPPGPAMAQWVWGLALAPSLLHLHTPPPPEEVLPAVSGRAQQWQWQLPPKYRRGLWFQSVNLSSEEMESLNRMVFQNMSQEELSDLFQVRAPGSGSQRGHGRGPEGRVLSWGPSREPWWACRALKPTAPASGQGLSTQHSRASPWE